MGVNLLKRILKKVVVRNFRLFGSEGRTFEFGGGFTEVIANNGAGKTSLWLAIKIGLAGGIPREFSRLGDDGLIHFPQMKDHEKAKLIQEETNAEIKIVLNNELLNGRKQFNELDPLTNEIIIETIIPPSSSREKYRVNGLRWEKKELKNALKRAGVNPNDPLLFLEQFKAAELLVKGPVGLLTAFEDSIGILETRENLQQALDSYEETKIQCVHQRTRVSRLQDEFSSLKDKYNEFKKYQEIKTQVAKCKEELNSRKLIEAILELETIKKHLKKNKEAYQDLISENENNLSDLNSLRKKYVEYEKIRDSSIETIDHIKENIIELKTEEKSLIKKQDEITLRLEEIEKIERKIKDIKLNELIQSLTNKITKIENRLNEKKEKYQNLKEELDELKKGRYIGPKQAKNLIRKIKKMGFQAEFLVDAISHIEEDEIERKDLIDFESILGDLRWSILIFTFDSIENKIINVIKEHNYRGYIIHLQENHEKELNYLLKYKSLNLKLRTETVKGLINQYIEDFNREKQINFNKGIYKDKFGLKFFLIGSEEVLIDRKARLNRLKEEIEKNLKQRKKIVENLNKVSSRLEEAQDAKEKLEIKEQLIKEIENIYAALRKNKENKHLKEILKAIFEPEKKLIFAYLSEIDRKIGSLEIQIEQNRQRIQELKPIISQNETNLNWQQDKIDKIIAEYGDLRNKFPSPRPLDTLNYEVYDLSRKIKELEPQDESVVYKYETIKSNLSNAKSILDRLEIDLEKHLNDVKKYKEQHSAFVERFLKIVRVEFSKTLKTINYDGQLIKQLYESRGSKWFTLEDDEDIEMTTKMAYGLDIRIKKPGDRKFYRFFNPNGQRISYRHSGGQREIVMLAFLIAIQKALRSKSKFYVVDEPTPHTDTVNTAMIMKLFSETMGQIVLFTPRHMTIEHFDEIIAIGESDIKKISETILDKLRKEKIKVGNNFQVRRGGEI